ncbi:MAG: TonB-dependent receptor domain-containing protein [Acidobacteriota bacterium]
MIRRYLSACLLTFFGPWLLLLASPAAADSGHGTAPLHLATSRGCAQARLTGVVLDGNGEPIAAAAVRLFGANRLLLADTTTDRDGRFSFPDLAPGTYEIRVTAPPFGDRDQVVTLGKEPVDLTINMLAGTDETVTVTATRGMLREETKVAASVHTLGVEQLQERAADLLPRMLSEEPGVIAQQTTPGQGSPILRGQSAQSILYLFDGVRYNNSTYRGGNTQYLAWIPAAAVDAVEILLGPAGVNYGSDALGGAINMASRPVPGFPTEGWRWHGSLRSFGEAASKGVGADLSLGVAGPHFAALLGSTGARHQDLRTGGGEDSHNALIRFLGLSRRQVRKLLGSRLRDTAFGRSGFTSKVNWRPGETANLTGYFMRTDQNDVRRTDRLLGGDGRFRADFTPQRLEFGYLRYQDIFGDVLFQSTFSVNRQTDGRRSQTRPSSNLRRERNGVTSIGYETTASFSADAHLFSFGGEVFDEFLDTEKLETTPSGRTFPVRARFPNGARYTSVGIFLLDEWAALPGRLQVSAGTRFSSFHFRADASDNLIDGEPVVPSSRETFTDLTFNAGTTVQITDELSAYSRVARGFRAPSVFDLSEQGLTGGGFEVAPVDAVGIGALVGDSAGIDAASTGRRFQALEPEVLWSFEGGLRWRSRDTRIDFSIFDNEGFDKLARRAVIVPDAVVGQTIGDRTIVGQDARGRIFVDIDPRPVVSRANIGRQRVWGIEWLLQHTWNRSWKSTVKGGLQRGHELDTGNFARKIAPDNLNLSLRWSEPVGRLWLEGYVQAFRAQGRLNPSELTDARIGAFRSASSIANFFNNGATVLDLVEDGVLTETGETLEQVQLRVLGPGLQGQPLFDRTPGFVTLNFRGSAALTDNQHLTFTAANLLDKNYRIHGSGFDAPGINLSLAYEASF